jgi:hypothetical protein
MKLTVGLDEIDPALKTGDHDGVLTAGDILDARTTMVEEERRPTFFFAPPEGVSHMYKDDRVADHMMSVETILRNPVVEDVDAAIETFEDICHPDAEMMVFGMHVIETTDLLHRALMMPATETGMPDTDSAIEVKY